MAGRRRTEVVAEDQHSGDLSNVYSNIRRWITNDTRVPDVLFALSNANELAALLRAADFRDVAIQQRIAAVAFLQSRICIEQRRRFAADLPGITRDEAARAALIDDARNALAQYTSKSELALPIGAHLLTARV